MVNTKYYLLDPMSKGIFFKNLDDLKQSLGTEEGIRIPMSMPKEEDPQWFAEEYEGKLSVDVFETEDEIVIKSTIAGVSPEDLDIFLHDDIITIRGKRTQMSEEETAHYFYKECYWGGFSRSIILPVEVNPDRISASLKNGLLTIRLPKIERSKTVTIRVTGA